MPMICSLIQHGFFSIFSGEKMLYSKAVQRVPSYKKLVFSNQAVQFLINKEKIKMRGWLASYMSNKKLGPAARILFHLQARLPS